MSLLSGKKDKGPIRELTFGEWICQTIYNPETGAVLTRTPKSWAQILLFFICLYTGIACFCAGMMAVFFTAFIDDFAPVLTGSYSEIKQNPSMGFQPMIEHTEALIHYEKSNATQVKFFTDAMDDFLKTAQAPERTKTAMNAKNYFEPDMTKLENCTGKLSTDRTGLTQKSKPCAYSLKEQKGLLEACREGDYGYSAGTPCVIIKMNRVMEWMPELKDGEAGDEIEIECDGEHLADKDNIGTIKYFPESANGKGSIKNYYFPYLGNRDFMSPLIFVKLETFKTGVVLQMICKPINVKNHDSKSRKPGEGRVHVELFIEE